VKSVLKLAAAFLVAFALCGCGKNNPEKLDGDAPTRGCASSLRALDAAKHHWAELNNAAPTATPTQDDLMPLFRHEFPRCPGGGTYTIGAVSELPQCSIPAHNDFFKDHQAPPP
jgi:hypothetical protein